jgi:homoserine dehydrogenase
MTKKGLSMPFGVGVIGAGTVGGGVIRTLLDHRETLSRRSGVDVVLSHVAEKDARRLEGLDLTGVKVSSDASALIADPDVTVVVELIGGLEPAKTLILRALSAKKNVVTANKMLLAHHGPELSRAALENGVDLRYEASVAGTIPIIKALREGLVANEIESAYGILNGTCNYILTQMTYKGMEFDEALAQAIELGFAETPPDLDIEGHDTAHKCQILASLCYSTRVDLKDVYVEGITGIRRVDVAAAREMGYVLKLLAIIRKADGEIEARVHPTLVPETHLLASVRNEFNAVYVKSNIADITMYYGRGAGRMPTASAVVADIVDVARRGDAPPMPAFLYANRCPIRDIARLEGRYYIRVTPEDKPGVLGRICGVLGEHEISIASCSQKENKAAGLVHVVLITHETTEAAVREAVGEIDKLGFVREASQALRVL